MIHKARIMSRAWLASAVCLCACATPTERVQVSDDYRAAAESFYVSPRERGELERKALSGDIFAAKKLVTYHLGVTGDEKQYRRWLAVAERLQKEDGAKSKQHAR